MESALKIEGCISDFFIGRDIFITGGTGFMGKVLIEKLLRSCSGLNRVFVLIRSKNNQTANERLEELKKNSVYDRLHEENPKQFDKLIAVQGDVMEIGLGLSSEDIKKMENVSIVFHVAANVRFDDSLKTAILMNTRGTHETLLFAETLKNLKIFLHVSTTYCNPFQMCVEEKLYPAPGDWQETIRIAESVDEDLINILTCK